MTMSSTFIRIVGLAESIEHWDYSQSEFLFAFGTGYASPMFMEIGSLSVSHRLYDQRWKSCFILYLHFTLGTSLTSYIVVSNSKK